MNSMGLMKLLFFALNSTINVNNLTNISPYTLTSVLYDNEIDYAGGEILLLSNHYIVTTYYGFEYQAASKIELVYEIPYNLRFEPNATFGEISSETCNFILNEENGLTKFDTINILMIQNLTSYHCFNENVNRRMMTALVDEVNFEGGILSKELQITFYELTNEKEITVQIDDILDICNISNIHTIFLFSTVEVRDLIYNSFEESSEESDYDFMFFYFGPNEGEICKEKMIFADVTQNNYAQTIIDYIIQLSYDYFLIIGSGYKYGLNMQQTLKESLYNNGYNSSQVAVWNLLNEDDTLENVKTILKTRVLGLNKTDLPIIITSEKEFHPTLLQAMKDLKIDEEHGYIVYIVNLNILQTQSIGYNYVNNTIYVTQYNTEGKEYVSEDLFYQLHMKMMKEIGNYIPITTEMILLYHIYQQWKRSMITAGSELPNLYRQFLYHQATEDAVCDTFEIYYNGYGQASLYLLKVYILCYIFLCIYFSFLLILFNYILLIIYIYI